MRLAPRPSVAAFVAADKILGLVTNRDVGPEVFRGGAFFRRAGRGDDLGAEGLGECDRGADTGRSAVNQNPVAFIHGCMHVNMFCQQVKKVSGIAAASIIERRAGTRQGMMFVCQADCA